MRTTEITVTVKRVIQTDSYESASVEITETAVLDKEDDAEEARAEIYKNVTKAVKKGIDNEFRKYVDSKSERAKEAKRKS